MKTIEGTYKAENGKDYYYIALNLATDEYVQIKNAGCIPAAMEMAYDYFKIESNLYGHPVVKLFFHNTCDKLDLKMIPQKYCKYFQYKDTEKYAQMKQLNSSLTEATGIKHYPTIGEALEAKFIEKGMIKGGTK